MIFNTISGHNAKQQFSFVASHFLFPRVQRVWVYLKISSLISAYQCVSSSKRATNTSFFYKFIQHFYMFKNDSGLCLGDAGLLLDNQNTGLEILSSLKLLIYRALEKDENNEADSAQSKAHAEISSFLKFNHLEQNN